MIYFDTASTFAPTIEALNSYLEVTRNNFGNSSSTHGFGRASLRLLDAARNDILDSLGVASTHKLVFTSGASEANNLALKGAALSYCNRGKRILVSPIEHPSVTNVLHALAARNGFIVETLPVTSEGIVTPESLQERMGNDVILVSIMAVNNETGVIEPIEELASVVHSFPKAFFHSDVTQAMGKIPLPYSCIDMFSFSGHKIGALKGSGALIYKKTMRLVSLLDGGEQEGNVRAGTVDVAGAKALATALKNDLISLQKNLARENELSSYLKAGLSSIEEVTLHVAESSSPYLINFSLASHKASVIVEALSEREIYVSSVSACRSKGESISTVLLAMGKSEREASNSIRVSMPVETSIQEIDTFLSALKQILSEVRPL